MKKILRIFVLLVYAGMAAGDSNMIEKITKEIEQETKKPGTTGRLNCTVSNPSRYKVNWSKVTFKAGTNGGELEDVKSITSDMDIVTLNPPTGKGNQLKYGIQKRNVGADGVATWMLIINSLQEQDAGWYRCQIMTPSGTNKPYKDGVLAVQRPPKIDESRTSKGPVYFEEQKNYAMKCFADGIPLPRMSWSRANGGALPNGNYKTYGNYLNFTSVTYRDRGVYRCNADNNVIPPGKFDIEVVVYFKPQARAFRSYVGQAPDRNFRVEMTCVMSGYPRVDARWYHYDPRSKQRTRIIDDSKHDIYETTVKGIARDLKEGDRWVTLAILNVQSMDYGNYSCDGINALGENRDFVYLYYTEECQGPTCRRGALSGASFAKLEAPILLLVAISFWAIRR